MIRMVVAEDQWAVRSGLVMILDTASDIDVVAEVCDGNEAVASAQRNRADVVLMDVRMPRKDGVTATHELAGTGTDVLILTTFDLDEYVFGALRAGAAGFLLKNIEADQLVEAVRVVARGEGMIAPAVTRRLIAQFAATSGHNPTATRQLSTGISAAALAELTDREREVLARVGEGWSNHQLARRLSITETTAKTHVSRILGKLNLQSRVQIAIVARELGITR